MAEARSPELDLEEIAAYVDGRLAGERKARVEQILVRDEDAYEIFLGTAAFEEETAAPSAPAEPVWLARPWLRRPGRAGALVAAALAAVVLGVLLQWALFDRSATRPRVAELAPAIEPGTDLDRHFRSQSWDDPDWRRVRSADRPFDHLTGEERAFRMGVRVVDLDVTLRAGDPRSQRFAGQIRDLARAEDRPGISKLYGDLRLKLEKGSSLEELRSEAEKAEGHLTEDFASPSYTLGRIVESGRLAALAGDGELFERPAFRSELQQAIREAREGDVAASLRAVAERLEQEDALDGGDFKALADGFARIIQAAG